MYRQSLALLAVSFLVAGLSPAPVRAGGMSCLTNIADVLTQTAEPHSPQVRFRLTGTVLNNTSGAFYSDGHAITFYCLYERCKFPPGDLVRIEGGCTNNAFLVHSFTRLGRGEMPLPDEVTTHDIQKGRCANRFVTFKGKVIDIFREDIDSRFLYIVIRENNADAYFAIGWNNSQELRNRRLIGAEVKVTGVCRTSVDAQRHYAGNIVEALEPNHIDILVPPVTDPRELPALDAPPCASPQVISEMGQRRVEGTVLAVMADNSFLLRDDRGALHRISPDVGLAPPKVQDIVIAGGTVRTDFYLVNLSHAIHSVIGHSAEPFGAPADIRAESILHSDKDNEGISPAFYGKAVRIHGKVMQPHVNVQKDTFLYLDDESHTVPIDIAATGLPPDRFPVGTVLSAVGICLMDVENWTPDVPFCKIRGFSLVARTPEDIRVLSHPPWWTPGRLSIALGSTFAALLFFLAWNQILRRHIEKRTRELLDEQMAHARSEFRTAERTNLAIELHDTLSQDLSAVACQIDATSSLMQSNPREVFRTLDTLGTMLLSCRTELKRCLWDLRNETLEDIDLTHAIRRTLQPLMGACELTVRFNVPRDCLTDSSAHAVLCIVRELVSNALTHGKATSVKIAGALDGDCISFSVTDNGNGFAPDKRPGPDSGHFGLAGVEARIKRLHGKMDLRSAPGRGTRAAITILISEPQEK